MPPRSLWGSWPPDGVVVAETDWQLDGVGDDDDEYGEYEYETVQVRRSPDGQLWISADTASESQDQGPFDYHSEQSWNKLTLRVADEYTEFHTDHRRRQVFRDQVYTLLHGGR